MNSQTLKRLVRFILPALLGFAVLSSILLLLPQLTKAQSSVEFTVSPAEQTILPGSSASFNITITNTGAISLTNIIVQPEALRPTEADFLRNCRRSPLQIYNNLTLQWEPLILGIGESYGYSCSEPGLYVDAQQTVLLAADATDGNGTVADSAAVTVHVEHLAANFDTAEYQAVSYGETAALMLIIANSGTLDLTDISVTPRDAAFSDCIRTASQLPALSGGQTTTLNCESTNLFEDTEVVFDVAATLDGGTAVSEIAYLYLYSSKGLELEVSPQLQTIPANTTADLTVTLRNPDNVPMTNLALTSTDFPACNKATGSLPDLAGGENHQFNCQTPQLATDSTYTMTASAMINNLAITAVAHTTINVNSQVDIEELTHTFLPVMMNNYQRPFTLPDLAITQLTVNQISNNSYSINMTVKNHSTLPVAIGNNFFANAYLNSNLNSPIFVCSLQGQWFGAGQSYTCSGQITLSQGSHVIRAWADPYGSVIEEYETNNTRDLEVTHE